MRSKCKACGSSKITHLAGPIADDNLESYWEQNADDDFTVALFARRSKQARSFLNRYLNVLGLRKLPSSAVFDYGCGLGAMVTVGEELNFKISGSDLSVPRQSWIASQSWRAERFVQLDEPWQVPRMTVGKARCIFLLDVLEHNDRPLEFLETFNDAECFIIKVPNVRGPLGLVASASFRVNGWLFNRLALVGDIAPHVWFFTRKGLDTLMSRRGFSPVGSLNTAEVGVEAGARARNETKRNLTAVPLGAIGAVLGLISPLWSESVFRVYWRVGGTPGQWTPPSA